ncbi:Glycosyltransferase involved in cell wall bisynthesis [Methylobacterium sp. 174MFSha1.1]|nr:Glycosyltransferase involved in cell wall bisynthesis [Methylobacterium sp. 174MFSha1.1]
MDVTIWDIDFRHCPRWFRYDPIVRRPIRAVLDRVRPARATGLKKVGRNLRLGLSRIGVSVDWVTAVRRPPRDGGWGIVNGPLELLRNPLQVRPSVTGPGLLSWPMECPELFATTRIRRHLAASAWMADLCRAHLGGDIGIWPLGIETDRFVPERKTTPFSVLVYDKVHLYLDKVPEVVGLTEHVCAVLGALDVPYTVIRYGAYLEDEYIRRLAEAHAVVFLSQHETQGVALMEAMSCNLPILAWNPGRVLEESVLHSTPVCPIPASAIPYFSPECGDSFATAASFEAKARAFIRRCGHGEYQPRPYVVDNFSLESSARHYLEHLSCSLG